MVKAVIGEETRLRLAEDRLIQSGCAAEVGLIVGRLSHGLDKGFILDLVPTPTDDAAEPPCSLVDAGTDEKRKRSKEKPKGESSYAIIDQDWVSEHARQVSRMLVGGIKVIGLYVWMPDDSFKKSTLTLCQAMRGIAQTTHFHDSDSAEFLLLHIGYGPKRWICRNFAVNEHTSSRNLWPCDLTTGKVLNSLRTFRCLYNFDMRVPIFQQCTSHEKNVDSVLSHVLSLYRKKLENAKALIDGNLVVEDKQCGVDGLHEVELLLPFMNDGLVEACSQKDVSGVLVFRGLVCSFAILNMREPLSQAVAAIKDDILVSLQTRLDILRDEMDEGTTKNIHTQEIPNSIASEKLILQNVEMLRGRCVLRLPRRVFVPWLEAAYICDYLHSFENFEVLDEHCGEIMSVGSSLDRAKIMDLEGKMQELASHSFWDAAISRNKLDENPPPSTRNRIMTWAMYTNIALGLNFSTLVALSILILSMLVGGLLYLIS